MAMVVRNSTASILFLLIPAAALLSVVAGDNVLYSPEVLYANQALTLGSYTFIMQPDCNVVLYDYGRAVWATNTGGLAQNCRLTLQSDGNLVVYGPGNNAIWASNTQLGQGYYILILQRDRNVVIYGGARWSSKSNRVNADGNNDSTAATLSAMLVVNATAAEPIEGAFPVTNKNNSTASAEYSNAGEIQMVSNERS